MRINSIQNHSQAVSNYRRQYPVLDVIGKILLNLTITGLLLGFGFWLALAATMGPAYLPNVMDGALDMWIRFTIISISAIIWIMIPIWFIGSVGRYSYQSYKRSRSMDNLM